VEARWDALTGLRIGVAGRATGCVGVVRGDVAPPRRPRADARRAPAPGGGAEDAGRAVPCVEGAATAVALIGPLR